jgi:alkaline phosphatase D
MRAVEPISRRRFLQASAVGGAIALVPGLGGCSSGETPSTPSTTTTKAPRVDEAAFAHGVASGDPWPDSVVLWTRRETSGSERELTWEVAEDADFRTVVAHGPATASADRDWTVKVIAEGLAAGTAYHYRFVDEAGDQPISSPVGQFRTAPSEAVDQLRFGVVSCSNYGYGRFHAYRHLLERDLDAVIHLGDYIYEYANAGEGETYGTVRELEPGHEILTVADYRQRYAQYRTDPDLQELHRRHAMIHVWDDHEFADDPFVGGASNHDPAIHGDWDERVAAALQAYTEWMPTRLDGNRIYRALEYGPLATVLGLDRQRRFLWPEEEDGPRYLGAAQTIWLHDQVSNTEATWCLFAQQTTFAPVSLEMTGGGWRAEDRSAVLDAVADRPSDLVVLAGDIHRFHAIDVVTDPAAYDPEDPESGGTGAVEFACGSITSPGSDWLGNGTQVRWNDGDARGYSVLTLTPEAATCDFWGIDNASLAHEQLPTERWLAGWQTPKGTHRLTETTKPQT